jgi:hypothetical protein
MLLGTSVMLFVFQKTFPSIIVSIIFSTIMQNAAVIFWLIYMRELTALMHLDWQLPMLFLPG